MAFLEILRKREKKTREKRERKEKREKKPNQNQHPLEKGKEILHSKEFTHSNHLRGPSEELIKGLQQVRIPFIQAFKAFQSILVDIYWFS